MRRVQASDEVELRPGAARAANDALNAACKACKAKLAAAGGGKVKKPAMLMPVRWALTGQRAGPALADAVALLGRDDAVRRLRRARELCDGENASS